MALLCGVPMRIAVGTSSARVAATTLMVFFGACRRLGFQSLMDVSIAGIALVGGLLGGKVALKTPPKYLKRIFAPPPLMGVRLRVLASLHLRSMSGLHPYWRLEMVLRLFLIEANEEN